MGASFELIFASDKEMDPGERTFLRTLGHPVLRRGDGSVVEGLRRKDLALLAYLCVEGDRPFSRSHLAALLWGESTEERARHSLTQALRRTGAGVGRGALAMERDTVRWTGDAVCDAQLLLEGDPRLDELLAIYEGPFLEGFEAGFGSHEFSSWADARRGELKRAAVRWLDRAGERAERERDWPRALRIGERSVQIDREWEGGHRRVMRALLERGERNLALRHFREFARWLTYEIGGHPDPETVALADLIRSTAAFSSAPSQPGPPAVSARAVTTSAGDDSIADEDPAAGTGESVRVESASAVPREVAAEGKAETGVTTDDLDAGTAFREMNGGRTGDSPDGGDSERVDDANALGDSLFVALAIIDATPVSPAPAEVAGGAHPGRTSKRGARGWPGSVAGPRRMRLARLVLAGVLLAAMLALFPVLRVGRPPRHDAGAVSGEVIHVARGRAYLVFGDTLYAFPDEGTMWRCLGGWPRVRRVRALPPLPRRMLPSAKANAWLGDTIAVMSDDPARQTQYVSAGCVLSLIPDPRTLAAVVGHTDILRSARATEALLLTVPRTPGFAGAFPLRAAGTLIQGPGDSIRWVIHHGGALAAGDPEILATYCRTRSEAVRVSTAEFRYYQPRATLPPASAPCFRPSLPEGGEKQRAVPRHSFRQSSAIH